MGQILSKLQISMKLLLFTFFVFAMSISVYCKTPKWYLNFKQVELMVSTKQMVEELFNYPEIVYAYNGGWSKNIDYKIKEGKLSVSYSQGKCSEGNLSEYDVDKDVVIGITIRLKEKVSFSKLGVNLNNFDKREIRDLVGVFTYVDDNTGEWFNGTKQKLGDFKLFPPKNKEYLKCKGIIK